LTGIGAGFFFVFLFGFTGGFLAGIISGVPAASLKMKRRQGHKFSHRPAAVDADRGFGLGYSLKEFIGFLALPAFVLINWHGITSSIIISSTRLMTAVDHFVRKPMVMASYLFALPADFLRGR
jgi:hypothetical protein